ncbi:plant UBX domain-containing protein 4-like [Papaver somniferum]|uniref:plant UBX domain-containing protein 4-like n=1 Tax=Papaver somniferum TaxID=3469 RepID=UPI000E7051CB|nr:plant UBX domain-containing protein 4-like [Papaver somniferum]
MASVASASRLSVSQDPPPIDFSRLGWGSIGFTASRSGPNFDGSFVGDSAHQHVIKFEGNKFTVDGVPERDIKDPDSIKFLESISRYEIPEEFAEQGLHTIQVLRSRKIVPDTSYEEYVHRMCL